MSDALRRAIRSLAVLGLIASLVMGFGTPATFAQVGDLSTDQGDDSSDVDTSDDGDSDTADLTNETNDDADDIGDLTNETNDDADDIGDLTNETSDDGNDDTGDLTNETGDDGDADAPNDDEVNELPETGQGSSRGAGSLEYLALASVAALVFGGFLWTKRQNRV